MTLVLAFFSLGHTPSTKATKSNSFPCDIASVEGDFMYKAPCYSAIPIMYFGTKVHPLGDGQSGRCLEVPTASSNIECIFTLHDLPLLSLHAPNAQIPAPEVESDIRTVARLDRSLAKPTELPDGLPSSSGEGDVQLRNLGSCHAAGVADGCFGSGNDVP